MIGVRKQTWRCLFAGVFAALLIVGEATGGAVGELSPFNDRGYPRWEAFDASGIAMGVEAGTLGLGGVAVFRGWDWVNLRVKVNYIGVSYSETQGVFDISYDYSGSSGALLVDVHPGSQRILRLTAGVLYQNRYVDVSVKPRVPIGLAIDEPSAIGTRADYDSFVPYFGIGAGNAVRADRRLSMFFDLGIILQNYSYDLPPEFEGILPRSTVRDVEKRLDLLNIYPVVNVGITYHF